MHWKIRMKETPKHYIECAVSRIKTHKFGNIAQQVERRTDTGWLQGEA